MKISNFCENLQNFANFSNLKFAKFYCFFWRKSLIFLKCKNMKFQLDNFVDFEKMLQNAYLDAKIGVDTAENEPRKE